MPRKWEGKGRTAWKAVIQHSPGLAFLPKHLSALTVRHGMMWKEADVGSQDLCACPWVRFAAQQQGMESVALLCMQLIEVGYSGFIF